MSRPDDTDSRPTLAASEPDDDKPGMPGFATWKGLYWFVLACFGLVVIALTIFSRVFA